jgi:hypothetical protein
MGFYFFFFFFFSFLLLVLLYVFAISPTRLLVYLCVCCNFDACVHYIIALVRDLARDDKGFAIGSNFVYSTVDNWGKQKPMDDDELINMHRRGYLGDGQH